jgi:microcystin-dependent protein
MSSIQPFIGQIELFGGNFAPQNFAFCNGQLLSIADNDALFALIGTIYGGDGQNTFALPNLNGRMAVGTGTGPGLSAITPGQSGGVENVTLLATNLPAHTHTLAAHNGVGNTSAPGTSVVPAQVAEDDGTPARSYSSTAPNTSLSSTSIGSAGSSSPVGIRNPYLGLNYIIAIQGIFPSRN